jgi:hypothetical protein
MLSNRPRRFDWVPFTFPDRLMNSHPPRNIPRRAQFADTPDVPEDILLREVIPCFYRKPYWNSCWKISRYLCPMEQFSAPPPLPPPPPLDSPTNGGAPFVWETILRSAPDHDRRCDAEFTLDDLDEQRIGPPQPTQEFARPGRRRPPLASDNPSELAPKKEKIVSTWCGESDAVDYDT